MFTYPLMKLSLIALSNKLCLRLPVVGKTECRIGREISNRTKKCRIGHRIWPLYSLVMSTILKIKTHLTHKLLLHQSKHNSKQNR